MVKDKCVHKSGNQPGRVSRVWWRGRDSWMDRWTIWYLDGVTAYLDSYRYLYIENVEHWPSDIVTIKAMMILLSIELSDYRSTDLHHKYMFVLSWFAIAIYVCNMHDWDYSWWPPPRISKSKTGHHQLRSVPSGNTALHHFTSGQPAASTYIFMTELFLARTWFECR